MLPSVATACSAGGRSTLAALGLALLIGSLSAADWPGWRGPDRTGVSKETGLLKTWPAKGPTLVWQSEKAGLGYAGLAVVDGIVYTMGAKDKTEYVIALDGKGQELWSAKIGPVHDWKANSWSHGPNATPTVDGENVYALGSQGILVCVTKKGGKPVWQVNLPKDLDGEVNPVGGGPDKFGWGYSWSPLLDGDKLVITPGGPKGLFAALDKNKGGVLWRSKAVTDQATYSSPVAAVIGGVKQYVYVTQQSVVGVSAKDGGLLWTHKREDAYPDVVCPTPIVSGDRVYFSVGYGAGCDCLKLMPNGKNFKAEAVYSLKAIANKQGGVVQVGGYVYGFHEDRNWACQDLASGKIAWPKNPRLRQKVKSGSVLAADGRLYVLDELGTVAMLDASPKAFKVISQFSLPAASKLRKARGGLWTHPSLSDGKLYLRDQELVFCYQVK
jgi:outer membrane protein assembly factor BamB